MKSLLIMAVLSGVSYAQASEKICFGSGDAKSGCVVAEISTSQLVIKPQTPNALLAGVYPLEAGSVHGQDGATYLKYNGDTVSPQDCHVDYLVDQNLLQTGTQGLLKLRCDGNSLTYFCRDNQ